MGQKNLEGSGKFVPLPQDDGFLKMPAMWSTFSVQELYFAYKAYFFLIRNAKVHVMIAFSQMSHTGFIRVTVRGTSSWDLIQWPLLFAPWPAAPGSLIPGDHSFLLTLKLVLVGVHQIEAAPSSISGKEKTTLSECPMLGSKMQKPQQIILTPWLLKAEREQQWEGLGERHVVSLYLGMRSDNFSPMPSTAGRSLPGWGPVERFSPQIFCNKVRYGDCERGKGPQGNWDAIAIYLGIYRTFSGNVLR